jgi:hypothetical protein
MDATSPLPVLFSKTFNVRPEQLTALGAFDPSLNIDTNLFPDPLLLSDRCPKEFEGAKETFEGYFDTIRKLLLGSRGDQTSKPWREAQSRLQFREIKGTCLGYGANSIAGSGVGPKMAEKLTKTSYEIISLGIDDPDLFMAMGLFEKDFGPDLIGDMFTNVCLDHCLRYNERVAKELGLATEEFTFVTSDRKHYKADLVRNPLSSSNKQNVPVILLPSALLRDLPVALDWTGVHEVAAQNQSFRDTLNEEMAQLWSRRSLESKDRLRAWALSNRSAFGDLLDLIHGMDGRPYDFAGDRLGEIVWRTIADRANSEFPLKITKKEIKDFSGIVEVVDKIVDQFIFLIEKRDLWRDLYTQEGQVRLEAAAQRMFFGIAYAYCKANDLDITPEAESGRGPVDFKISRGFFGRILVEVKLSTNPRVVHGYEKQLEVYDQAEEAFQSRYLILDVGKMGRKLKDVRKIEMYRADRGLPLPKIHVVDGSRKASASRAD